MKHHFFVILFTGAFLTGCAGPRPFTMTCSAMGAPAVVEPGQLIDVANFSVAAPQGDTWCFGSKGPDYVVFGTHPLMGKYIEKPEASMGRNTIVLAARRIKHGAASLTDSNGLQKFVEEWVKRGLGIDAEGPEPMVRHTKLERFTTVRSRVVPWRSLDADCVRYEYVMEERNNPRAPGTVFILNDFGAVCHHPAAKDYLVVMGISERYERGRQIDPSLFDRLKGRDAEPFLNSLKFMHAS